MGKDWILPAILFAYSKPKIKHAVKIVWLICTGLVPLLAAGGPADLMVDLQYCCRLPSFSIQQRRDDFYCGAEKVYGVDASSGYQAPAADQISGGAAGF